MDFDEYWNGLDNYYRSPFDNVKSAARKAFEAATKIEREACAKACEALRETNEENPEYGAWGEHDDCAEAIRAR